MLKDQILKKVTFIVMVSNNYNESVWYVTIHYNIAPVQQPSEK